MPLTRVSKRKFQPARVARVQWDSFRKGLNTLLRDSELDPEQVKDMTNLIVKGKGIITQRPGTQNFHKVSENGKIRGLFGVKIDDTELLGISDDGFLTRKSGTSYEQIQGASFASGYKVRGIQLQGKAYIVQQVKPLVRYDGTTLLSYTTISPPYNLTATNLSGVTGGFTWAWRIAAVSDAGRTLPSDPIALSGLPEDLANTAVRITWSAPTGATGIISGYEIYGREQGAQSRLAGIPSQNTEWIDDGTYIPSQIAFMPDFNETGGPNAKYIISSVGKIILANLSGATSRLMWSGADVNIGKFHWTRGGGYIDVDKDDGTEITAIAESSENRIIVWKERAIYQVKLVFNETFGIVEAQVQKITDAEGCLSHDTVRSANNDLWFVGRSAGRGVAFYSLGYQPNILANVLRTKELSGSIRPDLESVNKRRFDDMWSEVWDNRYWWFIPQGSNQMVAYMYDFERDNWSGPHSFPSNPVIGTIYYDENGNEHFLLGDGEDGFTSKVSYGYTNDKGVNFSWSFQTRRENFREAFKLKTLLKAYYHLTNLAGGTVNVQILTEGEEGLSTTIAAEAVTAPSTSAGWGSFAWGYMAWGSPLQVSGGSTNSPEVRRYLDLNESNVASAAIKMTGTGVRGDIIAAEMTARVQEAPPASWRGDI
jgi:hypothetical protein